jgi:hypothetical protein
MLLQVRVVHFREDFTTDSTDSTDENFAAESIIAFANGGNSFINSRFPAKHGMVGP